MIFIAQYWWLWLLICVLSFGYGFYNQIRRMQSLEFQEGLYSFLVAAILNFASTILFIIAIVINLIDYYKK